MQNLAQVAELIEGEFHGDPETPLLSVSTLIRAERTDLSCFLPDWPLWLLESTKAAAVILPPHFLQACPVSSIVVNDPLRAIERATALFSQPQTSEAKIDPSARISKEALIGTGVRIAANTIVAAGSHLMTNVSIGPNVIIHENVRVGAGAVIHANAIIHANSIIGEGVHIESGAVVGALPFNFQKSRGQWLPGLSFGGVVIGNGVYIGANTVIDRGTCSDTFIGSNVCIDNLVQIAHDVHIGPHTAIAGCAAIGAFTRIGSDCILGGACCIAAYLCLTDNVVVTGMSTVAKSIHQAGVYSSGTMVSEHSRWRRNAARFRRLDEYVSRIYELEKARDKA